MKTLGFIIILIFIVMIPLADYIGGIIEFVRSFFGSSKNSDKSKWLKCDKCKCVCRTAKKRNVTGIFDELYGDTLCSWCYGTMMSIVNHYG